MTRPFIILILLTIVTLSSSNAAIYKGQKEFVKKCRQCHKDGEALVSEHTMTEWKALLKDDGKPLADIHLKNQKAKGSWVYFKGKRYGSKARHLKQFLVEYAKDSGNVPCF
jgi:hypothetical protein